MRGAEFFLVITALVGLVNCTQSMMNFETIMAATSQQLEQLRQQADSQSWGSHCDIDWTCGTPLRSDPAFFNLTEGRSLPSNISFVESRQLGGSHAALAVHNRWRLDCAVQRLGAQWRMNYDGVRGSSGGSGTTPPEGPLATPGSILTQYFTQNEFAMWDKGTALSASTSLQTYPALVNNPRQVANLSCAVASPGTSGEYVAMERPWYVAARSSPKDVVILIDVAGDRGTDAELRLQQMQATAVALLRGLSWTDFVAVVPYDEVANLTLSPVMVRASVRNVEALVAKVQGLTVSTEQSLHSCLGSAVWAAASLLYSGNVQNNTGSTSPTRRDPSKGKMQDGHRDTNATSSCTRAIVILSDGVSGIPVPEPVDVLLKGQISDAIVFGFAFKPEASSLTEAVDDIKEEQEAQADVYMKDTSSSGLSGSFASAAEESSSNYEGENSRRKASKVLASSNQMAALACGTNGVYRVAYSSPIDHDALANTFFGYFNALVEDIHGEPRWSEVYEDAFGQGLVASLSWPVYDAYDALSGALFPRPIQEMAGMSLNRTVAQFQTAPKQLTGILSMDIPLRNLSDLWHLSLGEVEDALILGNTQRSRLDSHFSSSSADKVANLSNTPKCLVSTDATSLADYSAWFVVLSILGPIILIVVPVWVVCILPAESQERMKFRDYFLMLNVAPFFLLVLGVPFFWTTSWDPIADRADFSVEIDYTIFAIANNSYPCCEVVNQECSVDAINLPDCKSMSMNLTTGPCNYGYFDCQEQAYSLCGTCYAPSAHVRYSYQGRTLTSHVTQSCETLPAEGCLNGFLSAHQVRNTSAHQAWVSPKNPFIVKDSLDSLDLLLPLIFLIPAALMLAVDWVIMFVGLAEACRTSNFIQNIGDPTGPPRRGFSACLEGIKTSWGRFQHRRRVYNARDALHRQLARETLASQARASINDEGSLLSSSANASMTTYGGGNRTAAEIREPPAASLTRTAKTTNSPAPPPPPAYMARPAPPPAPKSEHTLGLPSVHSSEGHLPPPPAY